jgi:DNA-binding MarR family transcriptional regulator
MNDPVRGGGSWTLLTGHGHVLVEIARNPDARIRDISPVVGLTERSVQAIVADLEAEGYITRTRVGRRVTYTVNRDSLFRHSAQEGHRVGPFLDLLAGAETTAHQDSKHMEPRSWISGAATADRRTAGHRAPPRALEAAPSR